METDRGIYTKRSYWLLIGLVVLQAAAMGAMVYFERESLRRDLVIEQRTAAMVEDVFPEILQDLSMVSRKASEIKHDVQDLKTKVAAVDEHVVDVNRGVAGVARQVEGVGRNVDEFVQDRSGLIWGHSVNPYVLVALLIAIVASIPLCGWFFGRIRREDEPRQDEPLGLGPLQVFSLRLDRLHLLMEKIHSADQPRSSGPELRKLVEETERLIEETRAELVLLSHTMTGHPDDPERNPENLH